MAAGRGVKTKPIRFQVHVTPRSRTSEVRVSPADQVVRVRVTAPPESGRANEAALSLLQARLGVRPGALRLAGGASSRKKWFEVVGLDEIELWRRLGANE